MAAFTVTITDTHQLSGISAARTAYNAAVPATIPGVGGGPDTQDPAAIISTDAGYVQFVMEMAATSYAKQYGT